MLKRVGTLATRPKIKETPNLSSALSFVVDENSRKMC